MHLSAANGPSLRGQENSAPQCSRLRKDSRWQYRPSFACAEVGLRFAKLWGLPRRLRSHQKEVFRGTNKPGDGSSHLKRVKSLSGIEGRGMPGPQFAPAGRE
jgi:hypothetical protein